MNRLKKTLSFNAAGGDGAQKRKSVGLGINLRTTVSQTDYLALGNNKSVLKLMAKYNPIDQMDEHVVFSDFIVKINKRDKPQDRVLVVSNKALYNLIPSDYSKCKRRIPLALIDSMTVSETSDEFVVHVPGEYDYRMMSLRKKELVATVGKKYEELTKDSLPVQRTKQIVLKSVTATKASKKKSTYSVSTLGRRMFGMRSMSMSGRGEDLQKEIEENADEAVDGWVDDEMVSTVTPQDFNLIKVIGRGSFGKVMLVTLKGAEDKVYAMKILQKQAIIERNQVEHTMAEKQILEEVDHPFLMKLHFAFQTDSKLYLVMDYLRGGELFFHLKNERRFNEKRATFYTAEILLGLGHLHSINVIYRDLKPENILLDNHGHLCLTDFGLSKRFKPGEQAETFCGTPEYLAPEIVLGSGHGKEVDWWSLGILLFEMIVGLPPFYSDNVNIMYELISKCDLKIPSMMSEASGDICRALLKRNAEDRLGSGEADMEDIKKHVLFVGLDWDALMAKKIVPDFKPTVSGLLDSSNFDEEFTSEQVRESVAAVPTSPEAHQSFSGFDFKSG